MTRPHAHLHAIDPHRYHETELSPLATFTLPFGITCRHCSYVLALVTDQTHSTHDDEAQDAFAPQIRKLQSALDQDHRKHHGTWRFVSDGIAVVEVPRQPA